MRVVLLLSALVCLGCSQSGELVRSRAVRDQVSERGVKGEAILAALRAVPREAFLPAERAKEAYEDGPKTLRDGTILPSAYLVGLVLSLARPQGDDRVMEFGTETGYQAAVTANLVAKVHSMDKAAEHIAEAEGRWKQLNVENVEGRAGLVNDGWEAAAPFDVILLWNAPSYVPTLVLNQLQLGGRLVMVQGALDAPRELRLIEKRRDRSTTERVVVPTAK